MKISRTRPGWADQLDTIADKHPGVILLQTIPGVGPRTAEAVVAYIDDAQRFARTNRVASYFGLVPRQDANVNRLGHITREGPGLLIDGTLRCTAPPPSPGNSA